MRILVLLMLAVTPAVASEQVLEEVLVVGVQPGPKMWRVSDPEHPGHELWVLGVLSPLPKDLEWDSASVEAVLADTEEVIMPPGVSISAPPFKSLLAAPMLWGIRNNPDKRTLKELLDPELYARWQALAELYLGGSSKRREKRRPVFLASELYAAAVDHIGLGSNTMVFEVIDDAVDEHDIPETRTGVARHIDNPRQLARDFKDAAIDDVGCLRDTIERLETDLAVMRSRAIAWAQGDVPALRALPYIDQQRTCFEAILESSFGEEMAESVELLAVEETLRQQWLDAVTDALQSNEVSFAVLPISEVLNPVGYFGDLRERGYRVRGG